MAYNVEVARAFRVKVAALAVRVGVRDQKRDETQEDLEWDENGLGTCGMPRWTNAKRVGFVWVLRFTMCGWVGGWIGKRVGTLLCVCMWWW